MSKRKRSGGHQPGDVVLYAGQQARVLRAYSLTWGVTGRAARTIELVTVRTTGALASEFTVDASQVRALSSQPVRYSRLGWTRTWKPGEDDDDDDYSDLRPEQVDALLTRMRSDGYGRLAEVTARGLQNAQRGEA
ncbi:MAG: hypothetical protein M5U29_04245 [Anaerolineae bacterium]|nr:hypothetical protein [Anaerolineae bacterium]